MKKSKRLILWVTSFWLIHLNFISLGICEFRQKPMLITRSAVIDRDLEFAQTAFVINGNNIVLDLGGHTIIFDAGNFSETVNREFENWSGKNPVGWVIAKGEVERVPALYFGRFDMVLSPGGSIESDPIKLKGGKTYIAFAFVKGSEKDKVKLSILRAADKTVLAQNIWGNAVLSRGYASRGSAENDLRYKPKGDMEIIIKIEVIGTSGCRLGMIDIKPAFDYGIVANNYHNDVFLPDIESGWFRGFSKNIVIRNGRIIQGNGLGVRSAGISTNGEAWTLQNLEIKMNGVNTDGIVGSEMNTVKIESCRIESSSMAVFNRMHGTAGINLGKAKGLNVIRNNNIEGVPQAGINITGCYFENDNTRYQIIGNTIKQKEVITGGYAIGFSGIKDFVITGNTIEPYQGRGILIDASAGCSSGKPGTLNGSIYDNRILGLYEVGNFEYRLNELECVGIRIRNWGEENQSHKNLQIYNNVIRGRTDTNGVHKVYGINITASSPGDSIHIFENDVSVSAEGQGRTATALAFQGTTVNGLNYVYVRENKLSSNSEIIRFGGSDGADVKGVLLEGNMLTRLRSPAPNGKPFIYGYWNGKAMNNIWAKNIFQSPEVDPSLMQNISFEGSGVKNLMIGRYKLEVIVRSSNGPISGAMVTLKDKNNKVLFDRVTDSLGKAVLYAPDVYYSVAPPAAPVQQKLTKGQSLTITVSVAGISKSVSTIVEKDSILEIQMGS